MDRSYFNILDSIDPLFHSFVLSRIREIKEHEGMEAITIEQLTEQDQLDVLRKYCLTLYTEFRTLRSFLLDNMEVCSRSIRMKQIIK
jgi:hypothetical protein